MKQPPGLQLLHCLDSSTEGGKSFFVDSFAVAHQLFQSAGSGRKHFDALMRFPVSYHYNQPGKAFFDQKPTIEVNQRSVAKYQVSPSEHSVS